MRKFEVGDEVTYFKPDPMKRLSKIKQKQQGPYRVVIVHPSGVEYTVKRLKMDDNLEKPPRTAKEGGTAQATTKMKKARNHDRMIQRLTQQLIRFRKEHGCEIVMEHPVGSLTKRPFTRTVS